MKKDMEIVDGNLSIPDTGSTTDEILEPDFARTSLCFLRQCNSLLVATFEVYMYVIVIHMSCHSVFFARPQLYACKDGRETVSTSKSTV